MLNFIEEVISRHGGRIAGSEEEKLAQEYVKELFGKLSGNVYQQEFSCPMNAKFASMKLFCGVFYLCLVLYWISLPAAAILALVNAIFFLGHVVTYRDWLDVLYPNGTSSNVTAVLEPKGEVRSTILVAGHIDSVHEFQWWYKLKHLGGVLTFFSGLLISLLAVFYTTIWLAGWGGASWPLYVWLGFLLLAPTTIVMFSIHGKLKVDGAIDNLTGVASALEVGRRFVDADNPGSSILQHTRLKLVSFGAEEPGLKGSGAYVKANYGELKKERAVLLNVDSIKETSKLAIVRSELNVLVKYPKDLVKRMQDSFEACGVPPKAFDLTLGASDAARFGMKGLPAVTIIGLDSDRLDPTYHTRLDKIEYIEPEAMEKTQEILAHFIKRWDQELMTNNQ